MFSIELGTGRVWQIEQRLLTHYDSCSMAGTVEVLISEDEDELSVSEPRIS